MKMTTTSARLIAATLVACVGASGAAAAGVLIDCGGESASKTDGPAADAWVPDAVGPLLDADVEHGDSSACATRNTDGGPISDWPGWRRVTELDPCCKVDVALDIGSILPPLTWVACTNGLPNCLQLKDDWLDALPGVAAAAVTQDSREPTKFLVLARTLSMTENEQDVYDLSSGSPLAGWRKRLDGTCLVLVAGSSDQITVLGDVFASGLYASTGSPGSIATLPHFEKFAGIQTNGLGIHQVKASNTTFALDDEPAGVVFRGAVGSKTVQAARSPHPPLFLEAVYGDDVYAESEHGTANWGQSYRVDADGSVVLIRSNANAHVGGLRSDGATLFWTETYGTQDVNGTQSRAEVWAAPYTRDTTQLASTARLLATITDPMLGVTLYATAGNGIYAFMTSLSRPAWVVRASDGAVKPVDPGPASSRFLEPVMLTPTELWITGGETHLHLRRYSLGW